MATKTTTPVTIPAAPKVRKPAPKLTDRVKAQLNAAALRGKITVDELQDLQAHITKVAGLLA